MSLIEQGFRFFSRPDRKEARWIHPAEKAQFNPDWIDVTDMNSDELLAFFTFKESQGGKGSAQDAAGHEGRCKRPLPHGTQECQAAQISLI